MIEYSNVRYLLAKRPIDDRAINQHVVAQLRQRLAARPVGTRSLAVLELGAGVGTMVSRLVDWRLIERADYTLLDRDVESLRAAQDHLCAWGDAEPAREQRIRLRKAGAELHVETVSADLIAALSSSEHERRYDLVVANAVLDLFDLEPTLPRIWRALVPGGLFWFTINFDGETIFTPELALDREIMRLYHGTMSADAAATRAGHSETGRRLLRALPASGAKLLAAGGSDWVVFPQDRRYPGDEAYFLHHIVQTIWVALERHPELDRSAFEAWAQLRHQQIERGELCYIAHQLDVMGTAPS